MSTIVTIRKGIETADRIADFIANPDPSKPFSNAIGNAGRQVCDSWSAADPWTQGFLAQVTPGGIGNAAILNTVCKPYLDSQGYDPPSIEAPFTGGQCEGTIYQCVITADPATPTSIGSVTANGKTRGPITGWRVAVEGTRYKGYITSRGNKSAQSCGVNAGPLQPLQERQWFDVVDRDQINPQFAILGICASGPDDCGDPPGALTPGDNPAPSPGPFPPGEDPGFDPTGQPFFYVPDIDDPFGDIPIGDDPFGPDDAPGAGSGGDGLPGDPAAIGGEAGEVTGGEDGEDIDFGEPPEGRVWIGCIIETSSIGALGNIAGTGPESTVWPTVRANAALNYGSKKGTSNRINSKFHDLIRPATSLIVTGVFLQVLPGSTSKVFPLSALKCPSNPCENE